MTQHGIRNFLGLVNYYCRYIKNFSKVSALLYDLLMKDNQTLMWILKCDMAFSHLNKLLMSLEVLKYPEFDKLFELHTNASILLSEVSSCKKVGWSHGRAKSSLDCKRDDQFIKRSCLQVNNCVINCLRVWKHYLGGKDKTKVYTNNISIKYLKSKLHVTQKEFQL